MDNLAPEQYQTVLQYMQATNEEDFESAVNQLRQCDFNLNIAINQKYDTRPQHAQIPQEDNQEIIKKYIEFMRNRNQNWSLIASVFKGVKEVTTCILSYFTFMVPQFVAKKFIYSPFCNAYTDKLLLDCHQKNLQNCLLQTKQNSQKAVFLVISGKNSHQNVIQFLNKNSITQKIQQNFIFIGLLQSDSQLNKLEQQPHQAPQIIICRMNIFEEIVTIARVKGTDINSITIDNLNEWSNDSRNLYKRDNNVLVKYRNHIRRIYGNLYQEEEQDQVNLIERKTVSTEISQQNNMYFQMEQEAKKQKELSEKNKMKAQEEEKQLLQIKQQRKMRKMSLPQEPTEGEIVRLCFRCPNGSTKIRNFDSEEKLELVYNWVQLNEDIEFEEESRSFDLMHSYPPQPLSDKKHLQLKQIFEQSQQKILIKQL